MARGLAAGVGALVLVAGIIAASAGWSWREDRLAGLVEGPGPKGPSGRYAGEAADGGLLLYGDSRVAGWAPLPERPFPVLTVGYPGETAIRLAPQFATVLEQHRPAVVFVQMGVNDAIAASLMSAADREAALAASIRAFGLIAEQAQAHDVALTIGLVVPPIRPELARRMLYRNAVDSYVASLNAALPGIAERHGARVVDPMDVLRGADGTVPDDFRMDALHWTPSAYAALNALLPDRLPAAERTAVPVGVPA